MVAVSEIYMFIYAVGVVVLVGIFSFLMDYLYPSKIVLEKVNKPQKENYDWVSGNDHGGVILDD
jgi:hypothetical protein